MTKAIPSELGTKDIKSLLKQYAIPAIIAMTAASLYNIVDSIFIGHIEDVGAYALSGMSVTFPLMNLAAAVGTLVGVGGATMISILIGQKNYGHANKVLANEIFLNVIIASAFTILVLSFLDPCLYFFGASEKTLPFAREYMKILLYGCVFINFYFGLNHAIRAVGKPKLSMNITIFTVVLNTILDPIFIFYFDMGIKGAAYATVISQVLAMIYQFYFFMTGKSILKLPRRSIRFSPKIAKKILGIGMGPFLMNSTTCLVAIFINQQLRNYGGDLYIGAYGIINRTSFLFLMICMGITQGMQPIAGYNYGSRQYKRVKEVFKLASIWATIVCAFGFFISVFFPNQVIKIFTNDLQLISIASEGLVIINIFFVTVGFHIVTSNFFQCLGMVKKSIFFSLSRQLIFLIPALLVLPIFFGYKGVWMSYPFSDIAATFISTIMLIQVFKKMSKLKDGDDPSILGSDL